MILTFRDQEVLLDLHRYALLSTRTIASRQFPGTSMTTVLRRLRVLEDSGYIRRITCLEHGGNIWTLAKLGAQRFEPAASKLNFPRFIMDHDLKLVDMRLRLEAAGIARSWRPEHEIRAKIARKFGLQEAKEKTIPDGIMGVEIAGLQETIAVELELTPKNQRRYRRIVDDYAAKESLWGFWYVVGNDALARQLHKAVRDSGHRNRQPRFLCTIFSELMKDPLEARVFNCSKEFKLGEIWRPKLIVPSKEAAQSPAQGVSSCEVAEYERELDLNTEEDGESLTPAS